VFPSRSRPYKFFKTLDNIQDMSWSEDYFVWAKLDTDDPTMNNDETKARLEVEYKEVTVRWGLSENKVHAINRDLEDLPPCDILIIQSDDIVWTKFGFDEEIKEAFKKHFPGLDGTVHFKEKHAGRSTIIVSMVGVNLYKQLGYLYHPSYESVYSDNDFTEMTRLMGKYAYIDKEIFIHAHAIWNLTAWDAQYRHTERPEVYKKDKETYTRRKAKNFGV
jgi:hypothetical protein